MHCVASKTFEKLDEWEVQSVYSRISEGEMDKYLKDQRPNSWDIVYRDAGPKIIDFIFFKIRAQYFRRACGEAAKDKPFPLASAALAVLKMGMGECGEANQLVIRNYCSEKCSKSFLVGLAIGKESDSEKTHSLSLLILRERKDLFVERFEAERPKNLYDIEKFCPEALVIDAYFRESGELAKISTTCKKLFEYISEINFDIILKAQIIDSLSREANQLVFYSDRDSDEIVRRLKGDKITESDELIHLRGIYKKEVSVCKGIIRTLFSGREWKDSGDHLITRGTIIELMPLHARIIERGHECLLAAIDTIRDEHLLIVDGHKDR